jgi:hypothetical protein
MVAPPQAEHDIREEVVMALSTEDIYSRALELSGHVEETFLDLGKHLRQLQDRDPDLFQKIVDKSNLGRRKAYYLVDISNAFAKLTVSPSRLKKIGWTKLSLIAKKVTQSNVEDMLELCEGNTAKQIEQRLKGAEMSDNSRCVLMYFTPQQYEQFEEAVLHNGGSKSGRGLLNKEQALIHALTGKAK